MRLKNDKTLEKNLKLLKNCTLVKIMELTLRQEKYNQQKSIKSYNKSQQINTTLDELHELNEILSEKRVNLSELHHFLNDNEHSKNFQKFSSFIQDNPAILLSYKFKNRAQKIAEEYNLFTRENPSYVTDNLGKAFNVDDITITLNKDFKERCFRGVIGGTVAALGTAAAIYGATAIFNPKDPDTGIETEPTTDTGIETEPIFVGPISPTQSLNSYEEACDDFLKKTAEVYKYNTGKTIDLSNYGQENIETSSTQIYVVNYNGKTYRFSSQSPYSSNQTHLKEALEAVGATFEETTSGITYIHDGEQSIAIVDYAGNPIKSGNIMERATGGFGEMFNQSYVNAANDMLLKQGINTTGMSEAELVGRYLLSDNYNIQNDDLSKALGITDSIIHHIENSFWIRDGKEDSYAIYLYEQQAKDFENNFNSQANTDIELSNPNNYSVGTTSQKYKNEDMDER